MNGPENLISVPGSEISGDNHAASHGNSHKKAGQQIDQRPRGSDGRKGVGSKKPAHYKSVRRIIHLLKHLTQKNRHCEADHQCVGISRSHVHCMGMAPSMNTRGVDFICHFCYTPLTNFRGGLS